MARVIFLQRIWHEYGGPEIISANLKRHNHEADLFIGRRAEDFLAKIQPDDIAAFSMMSGEHLWALDIAEKIKKVKNILIVFGGPHPTFFPEIINHPAVDIACCGEGEFAMLDLANACDKGADHSNIPNLSVKCDGSIKKNQVRPLIDDLDGLPFPDRGIYYNKYSLIRESPLKPFMASRGCPFSCSFCFNEKLREIYAGKGRYVRFHSPAYLIDQIKEVEYKYGLKTAYFMDDLFVSDQNWIREFTSAYKKEVNKPFICSANINTLNEENISLLKEAGCHAVSFGIETGNEKLRQGLLNKHISNERIEDIGRLLKKYRLKFITFNMIGFPGETVENALGTIKLNIKIGADYPRCSFVTPYPGTKIAESYKDRIKIKELLSTCQQDQISFEVDRPKELLNLHCFFQTAVIFPGLMGLIKILIRFPSNILFKAWWLLVYFFIFVKSETRGIAQTFVSGCRTFVRL